MTSAATTMMMIRPHGPKMSSFTIHWKRTFKVTTPSTIIERDRPLSLPFRVSFRADIALTTSSRLFRAIRRLVG